MPMLRLAKLLLKIIIGLTLAAVISGFGYQLAGSFSDRDITSAPPGVLVSAGGSRLHLYCTGSGDKTIVLEAGGLSFSANWALIQEGLEAKARVCSYDRAGLGWSQELEAPHTAQVAADQLWALLRAAGEPTPYVLVGHSLGGALILAYAALGKSDIAGLVFIDSGPPGSHDRMPDHMRAYFEEAATASRILPVLAHLGLMRLKARGMDLGDDLPPGADAAFRAFFSMPAHIAAGAAEFRVANDTATIGEVLRDLGDIPVIAIIGRHDHNDVAGYAELGLNYHRELAALSRSRGELIHMKDAGHAELLGSRRYTDPIIAKILQVAAAGAD